LYIGAKGLPCVGSNCGQGQARGEQADLEE